MIFLSAESPAHFKKGFESRMKKLTASIYLEAVFSSDDIAKYMTQEKKAFGRVNKNWRVIMKNASDIKNVVMVCYSEEVLQKLFKHLIEQLQKCQKVLSGYIEKKRQSFPTFQIQLFLKFWIRHLIHRLSSHHLQFSITRFLASDQMKAKSLHSHNHSLRNKQSQHILAFTVEQWVHVEYPAQIMLLARMIWWTERTEDTFKRAESKNKRSSRKHLMSYSTLKLSLHWSSATRTSTHNLCNPRSMANSTSIDRNSYVICITDVEREYSYKYLVCTSRLVISLFTDCCYITLTQAVGLYIDVVPTSPCKTETVKDMAKALDIYRVFFNCSD